MAHLSIPCNKASIITLVFAMTWKTIPCVGTGSADHRNHSCKGCIDNADEKEEVQKMRKARWIATAMIIGVLTIGTALADSTDGRRPIPQPDGSQPELQPYPLPRPQVVSYVVASPRATLASIPPVPVTNPTDESGTVMPETPTIGAAFNFARADGRTIIRHGAVLRVKLSENIEGVWYDKANGWLGTALLLDVKNPRPDSISSNMWTTVGRDGAAGYRMGPSIGTCENIGVNFAPPLPGRYLLRARILTYAFPTTWNAADIAPPSPAELQANATVASDEVMLTLYVISRSFAGTITRRNEYVEPGEIMQREDLSDVLQ